MPDESHASSRSDHDLGNSFVIGLVVGRLVGGHVVSRIDSYFGEHLQGVW